MSDWMGRVWSTNLEILNDFGIIEHPSLLFFKFFGETTPWDTILQDSGPSWLCPEDSAGRLLFHT